MEYKAWVVVQDDQRGWDNEIGSVRIPHVFPDIDEATRYIAAKGRVRMKPRLNAVPVKIMIDL